MLRVGTWNVQYARSVDKNVRRRAVRDTHDADIWVLTETHDDLDLTSTHPHVVRTAWRYAGNAAAFWTTVWSRLPVIEPIPTVDRSRTVAARFALDGGGDVIVYGTVLPWNTDKGPHGQGSGWSEFHRVTPEQGREWLALRAANPESMLVVAGDLNQSLGGPHYYGTIKGRALLRETLAAADLACVTEFGRFPADDLTYPPIDHVCVAPPAGRRIEHHVRGWNKVVDGVTLSDHSGVVAELVLDPERAHDSAKADTKPPAP